MPVNITFPASGDPQQDQIKIKAGYVEFVAFAQQGGGYFCGTCAAFRPGRGQHGFCEGLKVPVRTYGCCNNWRLAPRTRWIAANGEPL